MDQWILVLGEDDASREQLDICKALKPPLKGSVVCDERSKEAICSEVPFFPAFCHTATNSCVYGVRTDRDAFDSLTTLTQSNH